MQKKYIIVCAGGFGREIFHTLLCSLVKGTKKGAIAGFLDDDPGALKNLADRYPPILGSVNDYSPQPNELVFIAAGTPALRWKLSKLLEQKTGDFATVIHPDATLSENVSVGQGSHVGWHSFISGDVTIGRFVSLNCNLTVGHDAMIDDFVEVGPGTAIGGHCHIEEGVHIAPNCTIAPGVRVGAWSKISANTAVMRDVPPCSYVIGVPGVVHRDFFTRPLQSINSKTGSVVVADISSHITAMRVSARGKLEHF